MSQEQSLEPVEGMTGRERVLTALAHQEPDRVPIDFGSTWITTIHADAYEQRRSSWSGCSKSVSWMSVFCSIWT
jgi:hypothetical protein